MNLTCFFPRFPWRYISSILPFLLQLHCAGTQNIYIQISLTVSGAAWRYSIMAFLSLCPHLSQSAHSSHPTPKTPWSSLTFVSIVSLLRYSLGDNSIWVAGHILANPKQQKYEYYQGKSRKIEIVNFHDFGHLRACKFMHPRTILRYSSFALKPPSELIFHPRWPLQNTEIDQKPE